MEGLVHRKNLAESSRPDPDWKILTIVSIFQTVAPFQIFRNVEERADYRINPIQTAQATLAKIKRVLLKSLSLRGFKKY
jgi:hypothetical protein